MKNKLSILTATYNRKYIIKELYESLQKQTNYNFEWIIVDDGSTDETEIEIKKYIKNEKNFNIYYKYQKNHGKHVAINTAVNMAKGEFAIIVDSDDVLSHDAVETILKWVEEISSCENIAGVSGLKASKKNKKVVGDYPKNKKYEQYIIAKNNQRRRKHLLGDKAEVYRVELLKKYPFKVYENENFLTEDSVWNEFAYQGYYVKWYNKIIYYCDYLADGLTKKGEEKEIKNFKGFTYSTNQRIKCNSLPDKIMAIGRYYYISKKKNISNKEITTNIKKNIIIIKICYLIWLLKGIIIKWNQQTKSNNL